MKIFEIIFLYAKRKYEKWGERDIASLYALGIIVILIVSNIASIELLLEFLRITKFSLTEYYSGVTITCVVMAIVSIYLFSIKKLHKKENQLTNFSTVQKAIALAYVIISLLVVIATFTYNEFRK